MTKHKRFRFADKENLVAFVNWVLEQDDIPYAAIPSIDEPTVLMIHVDKLQDKY